MVFSSGTDNTHGANHLLAFDGESGERRWVFPTKGMVIITSPLVHAGVIYLRDFDGPFYAIEASSGRQLWSTFTEWGGGGDLDPSPNIGPDGTIYAGAVEGSLFALDGTSGQQKWVIRNGAEMKGSPAVGPDGTLYFSAIGKELQAVAPDGAAIWSIEIGANGYGTPTVGDDGTVFVSGKLLFAIDGRSGQVRWSLDLASNDSALALRSDGVLYSLRSSDDKLHAIDSVKGQVLWSAPVPRARWAQMVLDAAGTIFYGTLDGELVAVDGETGAVKWKLQLGESGVSPPALGSNGVLYVAHGPSMSAIGPRR